MLVPFLMVIVTKTVWNVVGGGEFVLKEEGGGHINRLDHA